MQNGHFTNSIFERLISPQQTQAKGNKAMRTVKVYYPHTNQDFWEAAVLTTKDGLTFVEHPVYGDEATLQIVQKNGSLRSSWAWDVDSVQNGDY